MRVRVYRSFDELPKSFTERNRYPEQANYFLANQWFRLLYETVLCEEFALRIYLVFADESEQRVRAALFCGSPKGRRSLVSLTNYYTLEYAPILFEEKGQSHRIIEGIVDHIRAEKPAWESVELRFFHSESPEYGYFLDCLRKAGFYVQGFFQYENWFHPIESRDFTEYFQDRPSKLKNTIKRKSTKLQKTHQLAIKYYTQNDAGLEQGIRDYTAVYDRSWKQSEPYVDFVPSLIRGWAEQDVLFLGVLYLDSKPVAAQLWLATTQKFVIYKLSYDEEYKSNSVGSILSRAMFEEAFRSSVCDEIDYGIGSEAYKRDWMTRVRPVGGIIAYNRKTSKGFVLAMIEVLKAWLKPLLAKRNRM